MTDFILREQWDDVVVLTLNRPEKLNAWHRPMRLQFADSLEELGADPAVRAIVVTGAGDRAFCAGQDLEEARAFDAADAGPWIEDWRRMYAIIRGLSKPLVMALNGVAAGSAFQVALIGDIRVGHAGSRMGQPEILSGLASITGPWIMREMLGMSRTTELTMTGRMMDGEECHALGLIHHLVARESVLDKSLEVACELASRAPEAMKEVKNWLRMMTEDGFRSAMDHAAVAHAETFGSGAAAREIDRFYAKNRDPA